MRSPNTLAAVVLVWTAGLTVFSLASCADSNVAPGQTTAPAATKTEPVQSPAGDENAAPHGKTRAEVKAALNQALMNGWHIDKGD